MRICTRCRSVVGTDWHFCRYCGASLQPSSVEEPVRSAEESMEPPAASTPPTQPISESASPTTPVYLPPGRPEHGPDLRRRRYRPRFLTFFLVAVTALGASILLATVSNVGRYIWRELVPRRITFAPQKALSPPFFSHRLALPAGSHVTVLNESGNVTITTWDEDVALITARQRGRALVDPQDVRIEVLPAERALTIRTIQPEDADATVDYEITLPRRVNLSDVRVLNGHIRLRDIEGYVKAHTVNGRIEAEGIAGAVEAETVNGRIDVSLVRCAEDRDMTLQSLNGRISLELPTACHARLEAETLHGKIVADEALGLTVSEGGILGQRAEGQLGQGERVIRLRAMNGAIHVNLRPPESKSSSSSLPSRGE